MGLRDEYELEPVEEETRNRARYAEEVDPDEMFTREDLYDFLERTEEQDIDPTNKPDITINLRMLGYVDPSQRGKDV